MRLLLSITVLAAAVLLATCAMDRDIVIGFSGQLTGKFSDLGVQGRNGATLAVEDVNAAGGVAGARLVLVSADDRNTPEGAVQADEALLDKGAVAVIGHMTSSQTMAAMTNAAQRGMVLVSPTTATPQLTGKKDLFFRVIPDSGSWAVTLAEHARERMGLGQVCLMGDQDNASYVETFLNAFAERFNQMGGVVACRVMFSSKAGPDWAALAREVAASGAGAVVLAASARDVASFARAAVQAGGRPAVLCPTWPYTSEILQAGGASVEGIVFSTSYTEENDSPAFKDFRKRYQVRFGMRPNFAAAYSYEALTLLAKALAKTGGKREGLEQALLETGPVEGVIGGFELDSSGDVKRGNFIVTISEGAFKTLWPGAR